MKVDLPVLLTQPDFDAQTYRQQRNALYPGVHGGFPRPEQVGGYSLEDRHAAYKDAQNQSTASRNAYEGRAKQSYDYVQGLPEDQKAYYNNVTRSFVPKDHAILQPLARSYADAELAHAQLRE
ncbi:MAG: hypothetical protein Q9181_000869 [Wetmoreana brouardii]